MTEPTRAVFLSYASQDAEAARRICDALRTAGIEVWFDQSELRGGDAWDQRIRREIRDCALFIPIISAHTNARTEGYFRLEWKLAVDRSHQMAAERPFLLPIVVDRTQDADALVPDKFREVQWTRLSDGETSSGLVQQVSHLLSPGAHVTSGPTRIPAGSASSAAPRWRSRPILLAIAAAVALVGSYFATDRFILSNRIAAGTQATPSTEPSGAPIHTISEKSVAVLPFVDMSENKDQEYFADGMAEEILDVLVKFPQLKVIARTSSFQFKGRNDDLRIIADKLGVAYILEGSVRKAGSRIRVTAQLIDTRSGAHRWAESYDRDFGDTLALQDEIAISIARALHAAVGADDVRPLRHLQNPEAYMLYLRARAGMNRGDQSGFTEALIDAERALALDPTSIQAAELVSSAQLTLVMFGLVPPRDGWLRTKAAAERALQIDPNSARGHSVLALVLALYDLDWDGADAEAAKAVALNPGSAWTYINAAGIQFARGRYDEAMKYTAAALSVDPLDAISARVDARNRVFRGDLPGAELAIRRSIELSPAQLGNHFILGEILLAGGQREAALGAMEAEKPEGGKDEGLALVYHALGRKTDSDAALARSIRDYGAISPSRAADVYAYRREHDKAFEWLEKAYAERDPKLLWARDNPLLRSLHDDNRWKLFLRQMNLPE